jgi:hypothetical protein
MNVLYQHVYEKDSYYYFSQDNKKVKVAYHRSAVDLILGSGHKIVYICDSVEPLYYKGLTILITSTNISVYKQYEKFHGSITSYYMPVWSKEEINHASLLPIYRENIKDRDELFENYAHKCIMNGYEFWTKTAIPITFRSLDKRAIHLYFVVTRKRYKNM